ncbi:MAG: hypothetical protein LAP21_04980 [Acidobacteriia bacterium]|nr:hypothetical protein [Terriglobia bacterium]
MELISNQLERQYRQTLFDQTKQRAGNTSEELAKSLGEQVVKLTAKILEQRDELKITVNGV